MITLDQLAQFAPQHAAEYVDALNAAMARYDINSPRRVAAFLSQVLHESGNLSHVEESLNYTPTALLATFNTIRMQRFTPSTAQQYGRTQDHPANQRAIANIAYANRMGNGDAASGDGWDFRGRGPIQLTGRLNYTKCGMAIEQNIAYEPDLALRPDVGCLAAGWFWDAGNASGRSLNALADTGNIDNISDIVNMGHATPRVGDSVGWADRQAIYNRLLQVLA